VHVERTGEARLEPIEGQIAGGDRSGGLHHSGDRGFVATDGGTFDQLHSGDRAHNLTSVWEGMGVASELKRVGSDLL
jgi:hypothetical protein